MGWVREGLEWVRRVSGGWRGLEGVIGKHSVRNNSNRGLLLCQSSIWSS